MFCQHEWELIFNAYVESDFGNTYMVKTYRCKKCGYSKNIKTIKGDIDVYIKRKFRMLPH